MLIFFPIADAVVAAIAAVETIVVIVAQLTKIYLVVNKITIFEFSDCGRSFWIYIEGRIF